MAAEDVPEAHLQFVHAVARRGLGWAKTRLPVRERCELLSHGDGRGLDDYRPDAVIEDMAALVTSVPTT